MGFYVVSGNNEFVVEKIISDRNGEFEFVKSFKKIRIALKKCLSLCIAIRERP